MILRSHAWYEHDSEGRLLRDSHQRLVPNSAHPLPEADQHDKLRVRRFLDAWAVPQPLLLHVFKRPEELTVFAHTLPATGWVAKPAGAAYGEGVFVVHEGIELTRRAPLNLDLIVASLERLCEAKGDSGLCYNLSSFLVEEMVHDSEASTATRAATGTAARAATSTATSTVTHAATRTTSRATTSTAPHHTILPCTRCPPPGAAKHGRCHASDRVQVLHDGHCC